MTGISNTSKAKMFHISALVIGFILARQSSAWQEPWNWIMAFVAGAIIGGATLIVYTPNSERSLLKWALALVVPGIGAVMVYNLLP